ncbi:MAG TPA: hypothetical protein VGP24_17730 [Glaciihabitans sp.]|jgi:hypothetical protein|nr:hypothetical protein [Glaciihabitans sp.]
MSPTLTEQLANRVRAVLRRADHPAEASGSAAQWRYQRDHWLDALDPRHSPQLSSTDIRALIDFLAESGPSSSSRVSAAEWDAEIDEITPELLFSVH